MEDKIQNPLYSWKGMFAVASTDPKRKAGGNYDIFVQKDEIIYKMTNSFLPTYQAAKNGAVGLLLNKLFSKFIKPEYYAFSWKDVKKIEHADITDPMGRKVNNFMFWDKANGNYENILFTLSPAPEQVAEVKAMIKKMAPDVEIGVYKP